MKRKPTPFVQSDNYNFVKSIPNTITLGNLFCGCLGIVWAFQGNLHFAAYMIWLAGLLDFGDGFVARMVGNGSELGKQLDSLADLISFGLLPSVIIFKLFGLYFPHSLWPYAAFTIVVFSALRLAKFNIDEGQSTNFIGLPTPANALLISSFPFVLLQNETFLRPGLESLTLWILIIALLSYLLVSKIEFFGLKFKDLSWSTNKYRFTLAGISLLLLLFLKVNAIPIIIMLYLLLSVWRQYRGTKSV